MERSRIDERPNSSTALYRPAEGTAAAQDSPRRGRREWQAIVAAVAYLRNAKWPKNPTLVGHGEKKTLPG
jgi:hypothetical protein